MARVVVLGGCGGIGSIAARTLAVVGDVEELVLADLRHDAVEAAARSLGEKASGVAVDATSTDSVRSVVGGADLVVNCIGPFYRFGAPVLDTVIDAGIAYVDVCDDLDATQAQLALDAKARDRGVCALIGMGNSPGLANVLARYAADHLLDEVHSIDIMHIHGGEPEEGPAVVKHRIHAMTNDVPVFVDGELQEVRMLEPSGQELVVETDFRNVGTYPVYPYPHPETITLPRQFPSLRRATNLGVVFPLSYFEMTMDMVRLGACGTEPIEVGGRQVIPLEFSVAHILSQRPRLLEEAGVSGPAGCLKIVATGAKDGDEHTFVFSLSSRSSGAGEGTGIPAALGAVLLLRGEIGKPGVHPPEAIVDPLAMLSLASEVLAQMGMASRKTGSLPIHIEHHLPDGTAEEVALEI